MQKLTVENCWNCPFNNLEGDGWPVCCHPFNLARIERTLEDRFPDPCPLFDNPIIIEKAR